MGQPAYLPMGQPYPSGPMPPAKRGLPGVVKALIIIFVVIAVAVVAIVVVGSRALSGTAKADYYTIGNDQVPSVKLALGSQPKLVSTAKSTSGSVMTNTYQYQTTGDQGQDMSDYAAYLHDHDHFLTITDLDFSGPTGAGSLARNSVDGGRIVVAQLQYDTTGYVVTIVQQTGSVTPATPTPEPSESTATPPEDSSNPFAWVPSVTPASGWSLNPDYLVPAWSKGDAVMLIMIADISDITMSPFDYTQTFCDMIQDNPNADEITSVGPATVGGGYEAWQYSYLDTSDSTRYWSIYIFDAPVMYDVEVYLPDAQADALTPEVWQMLNTFTLNPPR
ncbi:MAG: hypothetical protein FWF36_05225 [Propionibacteriaceae bacterium]|nr:hypothetical protein [Propionibacteriaceae bacterium]